MMKRREFIERALAAGGLALLKPWQLTRLLGVGSIGVAADQLLEWDCEAEAGAIVANGLLSSGTKVCDAQVSALNINSLVSGDCVATCTDNVNPLFVKPSGETKSLRLSITQAGTISSVWRLEWTVPSESLERTSRWQVPIYFGFSSTSGWGCLMFVSDTGTFSNNYQWGPMTVAPNVVRQGWNHQTLDIATPTSSAGTVSRTMNITRVRWNITIPAGVTGDVYIGSIFKNKHNRTKVSLGFDDGLYSSQWTLGYQYMAARGVTGYFAPTKDYINTGGITDAQLQTMHAHGWSIHNHTVTHPDLTAIALSEARSEMAAANAWLEQLGLTYGRTTTVYPQGNINAEVEGLLPGLGFTHGATVRTEIEKHWDGLENPYRISRVYTANVLSSLTTQINKAIKFGGFVNFFTHAIDGVSTTQAVFEGLVQYMNKLRDANVLDIVSLQEFVDGVEFPRRLRRIP